MAKNERAAVRLNMKELRKAALDMNLETNIEIAKAIGVSPSQLWKASRPPDDKNYTPPGSAIISGVLRTFGEPFERFFFLDD